MKGVYTALVTPFRADGSIDDESLARLVAQQVKAKIDGLVICGTTGESPTLKRAEKIKLFESVQKLLAGTAVDLVAGTGSNDTAETVDLTKEVNGLGIKKFLVVTPYYNKPTPTGMVAHFTKVADEIDGEVILYNVPGRTGVGLSPATVAELAGHEKIVALKEATGQLELTTAILCELETKKRSLSILSGDDATYFPMLCAGATGVISVASHLVPGPMRRMLDLVEAGKVVEARAIHHRFYPIFRDLFVESNPGPVKWALAKLGLCENRLRKPLVPVSSAAEAKLEAMFSLYAKKEGVLE